MRKGLGLRAGGVVDPDQNKLYNIEGPGDGGGTDDEVDVNVHGKNIKVSKNERFAVFPASIPAENIEQFIESQTGQPSATAAGRGLREGMKAEQGAVLSGTIDPTFALNNPDFMEERMGAQQRVAAALTQNNPAAVEAARQRLAGAETMQESGARTASQLRAAQNAKVPPIPIAAPAPAAAPAAAPSSYAQGVKTAWAAGNPNVGDAISAGAKAVANNPAAQFVGRNTLRAGKVAGKAAAPVAAIGDAAGIVDVATDDNMSKADVAEQVGRTAGKWGSAAVGAKAAAALATPFSPLAGPLAPAVPFVAGLAGGAAGYFGADALMDAGSGHSAPASRSNGIVEQTINKVLPKNNYTVVDSAAGAKIRAAKEAVMNGGAGGAKSKPSASMVEKTDKPVTLTDADLQARTEEAQGMRDFGDKMLTDRGLSRAQGLATDAGVRNTFQAAHDIEGDGVKIGTAIGADGKPQASYSGGVPTKAQYIGADGNPTNRWEDTTRYKEAIARNQQDKITLREMQKDRYKRSLESQSAGWRNEGALGLAAMLKEDEIEGNNAAKQATAGIALANLNRGLRQDQQSQMNADRTYETGRQDKHDERVAKMLDTAAGDPKADGYHQRRGLMDKYSSEFKKNYKGAPEQFAAALQDELAIEMALEQNGARWFGWGQKPWNGTKTQVSKEKAPWYKVGSEAYSDAHNRNPTLAEMSKSLTPQQLEHFLKTRVN